MIKTLTTLSLAFALAVPAAAQKMGSTNSDAPSLSQSFAAKNETVDFTIDYTAITWADGRTMDAIMDKDRGARYRQRVNSTAATNPLASLSTESALNFGGENLPAGVYSLYFTIGDDLKWKLNAQSEEDEKIHFSWTLDFKKSQHDVKRLTVLVYTGDDAATADVSLSFGTMSCTVQAKAGKEPKKEEEEKK